MSTVHTATQDLARLLLASEMVHLETSEPPGMEAARVFEKLAPMLTKFMGMVGFQALFSRALALARAETPQLDEVRMRDNGIIEGLETVQSSRNTEDSKDGGVVLLGHFLRLLVTFIGMPLTIRLLQETWPGVSMNIVDEKESEENI